MKSENKVPWHVEVRHLDACSEVDQVLGDFYHHEMPDPWPRLELPTTEPVSIKKNTSKWPLRSYLSLALSLLMILGGLGLASMMMQQDPSKVSNPGLNGPVDNSGSAKNRNPLNPDENPMKPNVNTPKIDNR